MNLGWFGVPPSDGSNGLGRLKPGLQAVGGFTNGVDARAASNIHADSMLDGSIAVFGFISSP